MFTVGGAISGYSAIGSVRCAMAPMMRMMIERTAAKIGRSMKKWGKRIAIDRPGSVACSFGVGRLRLDLYAWPNSRIGDPVDDDTIVWH